MHALSLESFNVIARSEATKQSILPRLTLYGLLRLARNDDVAKWVRHSNPTGKSAKTCPALTRKIFRLSRRANQR
jgi:hypothetical protein